MMLRRPYLATAILAGLMVAGCTGAPLRNGDRETLPPFSSSLAVPDLLSGSIELASEPDAGWTLARVVLEGPNWTSSPAALLGIMVETDETATAHLMVGTWIDRTTVRPVGAVFLAVPPNSSVPLTRFVSHTAGDLAGLHDEFVVLLASEGGNAKARIGLLPSDLWEAGFKAASSIASRRVIPTTPEAGGSTLWAGAFWHYADSTGFAVDYTGGRLDVDEARLLPETSDMNAGRMLTLRGQATVDTDGIASAEFVSVRQPGVVEWRARLAGEESFETEGAYAFTSFFAGDVATGLASAAPLAAPPSARFQILVDKGTSLIFEAQEKYRFEKQVEENPVEPGLAGEATFALWGFCDVELDRLFGWPMEHFQHVPPEESWVNQGHLSKALTPH